MRQLRGFFIHPGDRAARTVKRWPAIRRGDRPFERPAARRSSRLVHRRAVVGPVPCGRQRCCARHARHVYRHRRRVAIHTSVRTRPGPPVHRAIRSGASAWSRRRRCTSHRCHRQRAGETRGALDHGRARVPIGRYGAREPASDVCGVFRADEPVERHPAHEAARFGWP